MPGPVPNRSDQRRRRNKPNIPIDSAQATGVPEWPEPEPHWNSIAARWFTSLGQSGQRAFYEPSDLAHAYLVAETMHRFLEADRTSGQLFAALLSGAAELLPTEASRRRLRIELAKAEVADSEETAAVAALADYQRNLAG
ncbi:hypothetical protein [Pseudonocardia alni]|uniref:phage terminase small subunit n=1 Tax=Pseudonocardia alni TaxID=33907 RepID=UPI00331F258F